MLLKDSSLEKSILIFIIVLALAVRICGISFGLPYLYHVDEERFAGISLQFLKGDLNPHFFYVPSLFTYLVAGIWKIAFLVGKIFGKFQTTAQFIDSFYRDPTTFMILGRMISILLSVGTILLIYLLGKKIYNPKVGLIAALFLIFSPEFNKISHYLNPDGPMVFFLVLSFFFIWRIYQTGKTKFYILAGFAAGLAFATKYGGHVLFIPLFLAHLFHGLEARKSLKNIFFSIPLVLSGLFFVLAFFMSCPFVLLDFRTFWGHFKWQSAHLYTLGHYGTSAEQPAWLFYLLYGFKENMGKFSQFLVLGGVISGLFKHQKKEFILFSFPLILFLTIGMWKTYATRYLLPTTPFFILIGAYFLDFLLAKIRAALSRLRPKLSFLTERKGILEGAIVLLFLLSPGLSIAKFDYLLTQPDTRTVAKDWIEANLPPGTKIAYEQYCPPLSPQRYRLYFKPPSLSQVDLEWLSGRRIKYVIISDIIYSRFTRYPKEFPNQANFYKALDEKAILVKTFEPKWDEYLVDLHNPTIKIYRLSNYPNYLFPGNFTQYSQMVRLAQAHGSEWIIQSTISGEGFIKKDERVKNPYVKVMDLRGNEVIKSYIHEGEVQTSGSFAYSSSRKFSMPPGELRIVIGYEYGLRPNPFNLPFKGTLKKESVLVEKLTTSLLQKKKLNYMFFYTAFPNKRGDDYFQTVTLLKTEKAARLSSTISGGELRWGDDYVLNPFVQITDSEGKEIKKLVLLEGKVGSWDSPKTAPVRKSVNLPSLSDGFKIFVGYDYYYDNELPNLAGGPQSIEIKVSPLFKD
jgi:4-amino-4-deoxy-L-arabinose transferase-like glycosyltransferase